MVQAKVRGQKRPFVATSDTDSIGTDFTATTYYSTKEYQVDQILAEKTLDNGKQQYLIQWDGYDLTRATWEPSEGIPTASKFAWSRRKKDIRNNLKDPFNVQKWEQENEEAAITKMKRRLKKRKSRNLPLHSELAKVREHLANDELKLYLHPKEIEEWLKTLPGQNDPAEDSDTSDDIPLAQRKRGIAHVIKKSKNIDESSPQNIRLSVGSAHHAEAQPLFVDNVSSDDETPLAQRRLRHSTTSLAVINTRRSSLPVTSLAPKPGGEKPTVKRSSTMAGLPSTTALKAASTVASASRIETIKSIKSSDSNKKVTARKSRPIKASVFLKPERKKRAPATTPSIHAFKTLSHENNMRKKQKLRAEEAPPAHMLTFFEPATNEIIQHAQAPPLIIPPTGSLQPVGSTINSPPTDPLSSKVISPISRQLASTQLSPVIKPSTLPTSPEQHRQPPGFIPLACPYVADKEPCTRGSGCFFRHNRAETNKVASRVLFYQAEAESQKRGTFEFKFGFFKATKICSFWLKHGSCKNSDEVCWYAHWKPETTVNTELAKNPLACPYFRSSGGCRKPEWQCEYKHTLEGPAAPFVGNQMQRASTCWFWWHHPKGCNKGDKCTFAHADHGEPPQTPGARLPPGFNKSIRGGGINDLSGRTDLSGYEPSNSPIQGMDNGIAARNTPAYPGFGNGFASAARNDAFVPSSDEPYSPVDPGPFVHPDRQNRMPGLGETQVKTENNGLNTRDLDQITSLLEDPVVEDTHRESKSHALTTVVMRPPPQQGGQSQPGQKATDPRLRGRDVAVAVPNYTSEELRLFNSLFPVDLNPPAGFFKAYTRELNKVVYIETDTTTTSTVSVTSLKDELAAGRCTTQSLNSALIRYFRSHQGIVVYTDWKLFIKATMPYKGCGVIIINQSTDMVLFVMKEDLRNCLRNKYNFFQIGPELNAPQLACDKLFSQGRIVLLSNLIYEKHPDMALLILSSIHERWHNYPERTWKLYAQLDVIALAELGFASPNFSKLSDCATKLDDTNKEELGEGPLVVSSAGDESKSCTQLSDEFAFWAKDHGTMARWFIFVYDDEEEKEVEGMKTGFQHILFEPVSTITQRLSWK
ncbi:hypothetical protein BT63DRAFT_48188 [Microthyrium microscopicum]|uniref:Chromo domain-containing protein n=1 Tax=Microthyrium microscopicum TaxID=703497 RepID=A0A6A6U527_9PEZI|nr:hypothetical protein BT63DRAFT_48188 [Microthyrium microscopicum]